ncbi:MAG: hypothetical protein WA981_14890 [Glaciecola sp.]
MSQSRAQDSSDIWLGKLSLRDNTQITDLVRLTNTNAYTNQPYFFGNDYLYYTQSEGEGDAAQTDVFRFSLVVGTSKNLTQSTDAEYSPTPAFANGSMSLIRVNSEGKQQLWVYNLQGNPKQHLVPAIEPVGYHVWLDDESLLLFVLGQPHTLQLTQSSPESVGKVIDDNIGASLFQYKNTSWFLYSRTSEEGNWLKAYNKDSGKVRQVARLPNDAKYFAVTASGRVLSSNGKTLFVRDITQDKQKLKPIGKWHAIDINEKQCQQGISRVAVSPDSSMVALVCSNE